jgi:DNA-binding XRE family transcriptional regulator
VKFSPMRIIRAHRQTYSDDRTGRVMPSDIIAFEIAPAVVGLISAIFNFQLSPVAAAALLMVTGLLGALLFGAMLQASQRALDWADSAPAQSKDTSDHAIFMGQLAANAGYASLVCIAAAISYFFATVATDSALTLATAISVGISAHLVLVLLMVMRRVYALTEERLNRARSGADRQRRAS